MKPKRKLAPFSIWHDTQRLSVWYFPDFEISLFLSVWYFGAQLSTHGAQVGGEVQTSGRFIQIRQRRARLGIW